MEENDTRTVKMIVANRHDLMVFVSTRGGGFLGAMEHL